MAYYETQQQSPLHNPQFNPQQSFNQFNPQSTQPYGQSFGIPSMPGMGSGLGQAAYGQQFGQSGFGGAFGQSTGWGAQPGWWGQQQRQLSQQDVSEVVRQLLPALPQILAQAQQPQAAIGYAAYGQTGRSLTPQDVNEVVRQLLPMVPQIVGMLQSQPQLQHAAMYGGAGWGQQTGAGWGQQAGLAPHIGGQIPFAGLQQPQFGQYGGPQVQSAFGASPLWGQQQRQLTQQDVADVTRQLVGLIPQVIGNLQAFSQQRMI
jgi:hypothetical protein